MVYEMVAGLWSEPRATPKKRVEFTTQEEARREAATQSAAMDR
jgi:hypothetical protein